MTENDSDSSYYSEPSSEEEEEYDPRLDHPEFKRMTALMYRNERASMMAAFENLSRSERRKMLREIINLKNNGRKPLLFRILLSDFPRDLKEEIMTVYESCKVDDAKAHGWIESILRVPINRFSESLLRAPIKKRARSFLTEAERTLDSAVFGHKNAKHKIIQYLGQLMRNNNGQGMVLGIQGPMGNGKTTLVEKGVSQILGRPFHCIPLGGATDSSFLTGHSFTYEGSRYGQIMSILMTSGVMDPIIYFDELDKISNTAKGEEIMNLLIHLVDASQNTHFQDRYFGHINFDLSHVTFVFSYNDETCINPILRDRIFQVKTEGFSTQEKMTIARDFLIPSICREVGIPVSSLVIAEEAMTGLIDRHTNEAGVRKLKELLFEIYRERNVEMLLATTTDKKRSTVEIATLAELTQKYLPSSVQHSLSRVSGKSILGRINGLYATSHGLGGILPIESQWTPGESTPLTISITGNLGKVMTESVTVAKTVAWNHITEEVRTAWLSSWRSTNPRKSSAIHIHCEDMALKKEGPSAGCALAVSITSLLLRKKIRSTVGLTGEINLSGDILEIGGLREKLQGARAAGCTLVMFPEENMKDYRRIIAQYPDLKSGEGFRVLAVRTFREVLSLVFEEDEAEDRRKQK